MLSEELREGIDSSTSARSLVNKGLVEMRDRVRGHVALMGEDWSDSERRFHELVLEEVVNLLRGLDTETATHLAKQDGFWTRCQKGIRLAMSLGGVPLGIEFFFTPADREEVLMKLKDG